MVKVTEVRSEKLGDMSNSWSFGALDIDLLPAPGVPTFV
jgi:hypothetical protein